MKKKLVSVLVALSLFAQSTAMWAEESSNTTSGNDSSIVQEETKQEEEQQQVDEEAEQKDEIQDVGAQEQNSESTIVAETPSEKSSAAASIIKGDEFILTVGSKSYKLNGNAYTLTAGPISVEGRTYLPIRFVSDKVIEGTLSFNQTTGVAVIKKDTVTLQMTVGNKGAYLNGGAITLDSAPMVVNGTTYVPVRILSSYFGISVDYNSKTGVIKIVGKDKGINTKPIAGFNFSQSSYTEGQIVKATSTSYDPDGHNLVDKLWSVIDSENNVVTNKELVNIFKLPKAGNYRIGLKVQDKYGLWSDWVYKDITILPNQAPVITYLGSVNNSYAQGEKITYQYFYDNESWESITNEKWTYRHADEDISKAILGKPDALFTEGDYIVSLQIDDAFGNRSELYETTIHITEQVLSKELNFRFTQGQVGDIVDNYQNFNYRDYEDAEIASKSMVDGTMIMSDSPEEVTREGILYRDVINGRGRLLIHHINKFSDSSVSGGTKRLVVVAENKTNQPQTVTLTNKTIKGPVTDILYLGQKLLYDYLVGSAPEVITLKPGEKKYIYDSTTKWKQQTCISGLMDISTTGDVTFTMAAVSAGTTLDTMSGMELFLQAVHPRGTFEGIGINYKLNLDGSKPTKLVLGNGEEEWVKGYDALMQDEAYNKGNYGVSYYITITATEDMGILLNPRANVFRGAIEWKGQGVYNIPSSGTIFSNTAKAVSLGTIKAGETKTFEYMLPNGSSAPVVIAFIPKSYWND